MLNPSATPNPISPEQALCPDPLLCRGIDIEKSLRYEVFLKKYIQTVLLPDRFINWGKITKLAKVFGLVGPWGSGKSISGAAITIIDFMIAGYPVISNMPITFSVRVGDMLAVWRSLPLDKAQLYLLELGGCLIFIDEINIEFAEARRAMSKNNISFDKVIQLIRKQESEGRKMNLIYTVIREMYVDTRLRDMTSLFIKCSDPLLEPGGLSLPFEFGERCKWKGYDMMGILGKGVYDPQLGQPTFELVFNSRNFWNTYSTLLVQGKDSTPYEAKPNPVDASVTTNRSPEIGQFHDENGWVFDIIDELLADGRRYIPTEEFYNHPEVLRRQVSKQKLSALIKELSMGNIKTRIVNQDGDRINMYVIPEETLGSMD